MIKLLDEFGNINYCLCAVIVSCRVIYFILVKRYVYTFWYKKYVAPNVYQLLFRPG